MKDQSPTQPLGTLSQFEEDYKSALFAFCSRGEETDLISAFHLSRAAMALGIGLSEFCDLHHRALRTLGDTSARAHEEEFLLEALAVYDMALRGRQDTIARLQEEAEERQKVEEDLRLASMALTRQRDTLEQEVQQRTQQIVKMLNELRRNNEELRQNNQEQSEFTYAISHDLKSPTNTIKALLTALLEDYGEILPSEARELADLQLATVDRMQRLISDLLSYSNAVGSELVFGSVDLNEVLEAVVADLMAEISQSEAVIEFRDLPRIDGDETQLRILLQNLISNGIKFRKPDTPPVVHVLSHVEGANGVVITIQDNGIGIPADSQGKIFGLFQRLHAHHEYPGSGLGLAVCQRIVSKHHGNISLISDPGVGTQFRISLPRAQSDQRKIDAACHGDR